MLRNASREKMKKKKKGACSKKGKFYIVVVSSARGIRAKRDSTRYFDSRKEKTKIRLCG